MNPSNATTPTPAPTRRSRSPHRYTLDCDEPHIGGIHQYWTSYTAQVRIGGDVIFLRRTAGSWKVSAAGCKPQSAGPYECTVGG